MKPLIYENIFGKANTTIMYHSEFYTIVEASITINLSEGYAKSFRAEGISRRSYRDAPNSGLAIDIATGRAKKALGWRLEGRTLSFPRRPKDVMFSA